MEKKESTIDHNPSMNTKNFNFSDNEAFAKEKLLNYMGKQSINITVNAFGPGANISGKIDNVEISGIKISVVHQEKYSPGLFPTQKQKDVTEKRNDQHSEQAGMTHDK